MEHTNDMMIEFDSRSCNEGFARVLSLIHILRNSEPVVSKSRRPTIPMTSRWAGAITWKRSIF